MNLGNSIVIRYMSEDITVLDFNDALKALDEITEEFFVFDVWIPSLKRSVKFKELNAKQQKNLIQAVFDLEDLKFTFSRSFYDIILQNCIEDKSVIESFTIIDKASIAFFIKQQLSKSIKLDSEEKENFLEIILNNFKNYSHPEPEIISYSKNSIEIDVEFYIPTIEEDIKFEPFLFERKEKDNNDEFLKNIIVNAYLVESSKHIKTIRFNNNSLDYENLSVSKKLSFVEKLPAIIVQKILEKTTEYRNSLVKIQTAEDKFLEVNPYLFLNQ